MLREKVTLEPHNPSWKKAFEIVSDAFQSIQIKTSLRLHHIGSTSIPDIHAKPILDVLGEAGSLEELDKSRSSFESLGFTWKGEYGIPMRRYCVLYDSEQKYGFIHLHVFPKDHDEIARHLFFRDFLVSHPQRAKEYEALKIGLKETLAHQREKYTESKTNFIRDILSHRDRISDKFKTGK